MKAQNGNRVKVQFVGRLEDGTVFGESAPERPLEFTLGQDHLIAGFEEALQGMEPGQEKNFEVPPEKGFGSYDPRKKLDFERNRFAEIEPLKTGMKVDLQDSNGREVIARVESISPNSVTLDLNHPLAGQPLKFSVLLQEVG